MLEHRDKRDCINNFECYVNGKIMIIFVELEFLFDIDDNVFYLLSIYEGFTFLYLQ